MDGCRNYLHMRKHGKIIFTGYRDSANMFVADISKVKPPNKIKNKNNKNYIDNNSENESYDYEDEDSYISDSFRGEDYNNLLAEYHELEQQLEYYHTPEDYYYDSENQSENNDA